eukprot:m.132390 g.132390  ORF g.132390 m.132390 type:complete len:552 (+) comp16484_c0_seq1:657-2312(+)
MAADPSLSLAPLPQQASAPSIPQQQPQQQQQQQSDQLLSHLVPLPQLDQPHEPQQPPPPQPPQSQQSQQPQQSQTEAQAQAQAQPTEEPSWRQRLPPDILAERKESALASARALFDMMDSDRDGKLGWSDVVKELERQNFPANEEIVAELFRFSQTANLKEINFDDFLAHYVWKEECLMELFWHIDHSQSGALTAESLQNFFIEQGYAVTQEQAKALVARIKPSTAEAVVSLDDWFRFLALFPSVYIEDIFLCMFRDTQAAEAFAEDPQGWSSPLLKQLLAGGVGGALSRTCTAPLDRLKTLLQVQAGTERVSALRCFMHMVHEGGVRSLWRGNGVNVVKVAPESAVRFLAWEQAKVWLYKGSDSMQVGVFERIAAGSIAGATSQLAIFPMEVLKTRLAVAKTGQYRSAWHCASTILQTQGPLAFYRGLLPSLCGVVPYSGIDLALYETLKRHLWGDTQPHVLGLLACGAVSSSCGQLASYPLALIRTRMQAEAGHRSMTQEIRHVYRMGGVPAFYAGIVPNFLKVAPTVGISYVIYEHMRLLLGLTARTA